MARSHRRLAATGAQISTSAVNVFSVRGGLIRELRRRLRSERPGRAALRGNQGCCVRLERVSGASRELRQIGISVGPSSLPLPAALELAAEAENAGLGLVGCGDGGAEHLALMGAIAARTSRVGLVSCALTWARTPVTTAAGVSTLARLSDGRHRLAIGTMSRAWSEAWHGIDYTRPVARMRDCTHARLRHGSLTAVRVALGSAPGNPVTYTGTHYTLLDFEALSPPPSTPTSISLAASRPGMARLGGEIAGGLLFNVVHSRDWLRFVLLPAASEGLSTAGRPPDALDNGAWSSPRSQTRRMRPPSCCVPVSASTSVSPTSPICFAITASRTSLHRALRPVRAETRLRRRQR